MKKLSSTQGFTLIEVLIVVAIIAIIVGIGVPALRDAKERAVSAKRDAMLSNVATAKTRFILDNSQAQFDALATDDARWTAIQNYILVKGVPATDKASLAVGLPVTTFNVNDSQNAPTNP